MSSDETKKNFSQTLNLPRTDFPIRANAQQTEPLILEKWPIEEVYKQSLRVRQGSKPFILHNGPPYANGDIHVGHALNQTLKDIVCRSKRMMGMQAFFQAGWDCHGLPIELKVTKEFGWDKNPEQLDPVALKKRCKDFAQKWIKRQMADLKRLGIMCDFENYYSTMSPQYEAGILEVFSKFVAKGLISRREKTVPWCFSCQTTLASAEIEYKDRKDPSCFVLFNLDQDAIIQRIPELAQENSSTKISLLAWTTTPWTLPLNRALIVKPDTEYSAIKFANDKIFIIASKLIEKVCATVGIDPKIVCQFDSNLLRGFRANHPVDLSRKIPVVFDQMVSLEEGTAVVHCAPGCGPEDYAIAVREGIEIFSPLTPDGRYSDKIIPKNLAGMPITEGQWWTLKFLKEQGNLLWKGSITHSYPHCWRCKNGLMFRATKQWFCNLETDRLKEKLLNIIQSIKFIPEWGKARLEGSVKTRTEWCISRQRYWGVPIVALKCENCEQAFTSEKLVLFVAKEVETKGIDYWDNVTVEELVQKTDVPVQGCKCMSSKWIKEKDIIDVWFESGSSFWSVLKKDPHATSIDGHPQLPLPADLYLEGSDQHRAWFQTSLFCSMVATGKTCTKSILTHGYIVDANREKMSKSLGNTVNAQELLSTYGADIVRLWVCSTDYQNDAPISKEIIDTTAGIFRKIRNTFRFMISNIYDYDGKSSQSAKQTDSPLTFPLFRIPHEGEFVPENSYAAQATNIELCAVDRYVLGKLLNVSRQIRKAYEEYDFTTVFSTITNFCNNDLSAGYLDIAKDRLYVEKANSQLRRAAQATIYHILDFMTHLIAPVLPFLSEQVSDIYLADTKTSSIHTHMFLSEDYLKQLINALDTKMCSLSKKFESDFDGERQCHEFWSAAEKMRKNVLKAIEKKRETKLIKHSLEAKVSLFIDYEKHFGKVLWQGLHAIDEHFEGSIKFLEDFFITSKVELTNDNDELENTDLDWLYVKVEHAPGSKCPRCWKWEEKEDEDPCSRCTKVLSCL